MERFEKVLGELSHQSFEMVAKELLERIYPRAAAADGDKERGYDIAESRDMVREMRKSGKGLFLRRRAAAKRESGDIPYGEDTAKEAGEHLRGEAVGRGDDLPERDEMASRKAKQSFLDAEAVDVGRENAAAEQSSAGKTADFAMENAETLLQRGFIYFGEGNDAEPGFERSKIPGGEAGSPIESARELSEFFRRDSRRYDREFPKY